MPVNASETLAGSKAAVLDAVQSAAKSIGVSDMDVDPHDGTVSFKTKTTWNAFARRVNVRVEQTADNLVTLTVETRTEPQRLSLGRGDDIAAHLLERVRTGLGQ